MERAKTLIQHPQVPMTSQMGARRDRNGNLEVAGRKQILSALTAKVSAIGLENAHRTRDPDQTRNTNLRLG